MKFLVALALFFSLTTVSCVNPTVKAIHAKYPECRILKVVEQGEWTKAWIQCPFEAPRAIKLRENR